MPYDKCYRVLSFGVLGDLRGWLGYAYKMARSRAYYIHSCARLLPWTTTSLPLVDYDVVSVYVISMNPRYDATNLYTLSIPPSFDCNWIPNFWILSEYSSTHPSSRAIKKPQLYCIPPYALHNNLPYTKYFVPYLGFGSIL